MITACGQGAAHRGRTVVYASGADLQSVNPLLTVHPLAKQVERYVLLTTLVRYDSALTPQPYLARTWTWSPDQRMSTFRLRSGVRWHDGVAATAALRPARGGPARLERFSVVVVDAPTTKLAAPTAGEVDFAGIQPAHAAFVRKTPALTVVDYPLIYPYGIVFNTRIPPFGDARVRLAVALALDRREIVDGHLYGFGSGGDGPVPPAASAALPV